MKAEVLKWQHAPELMLTSPLMQPQMESGNVPGAATLDSTEKKETPTSVSSPVGRSPRDGMARTVSIDRIPLLDEPAAVVATSMDASAKDVARERRVDK